MPEGTTAAGGRSQLAIKWQGSEGESGKERSEGEEKEQWHSFPRQG